MIFNMIARSGDVDVINFANMNFSIAAYASESVVPSNTDGNHIAVITNTAITSWIFSPVTPSSPAQGMVWIVTGNSSSASFNALQNNDINNAIMLYPTSIKQYIDGAWVVKKTRINSVWFGLFDGMLFDNGETFDDITGGWKNHDGENVLKGGSYTETTFGAWYCTNNKIGLSGFSKLNVYFDTLQGAATIGISDEPYKPSTASDLVAYKTATSAGTCSLDISAYNKEYYVFVLIGPHHGASGFAYTTASANRVKLS